MTQKTFCDQCNAEIKTKGWWLAWGINDANTDEDDDPIDICTKCLNLVKRFLREMSVKKGK